MMIATWHDALAWLRANSAVTDLHLGPQRAVAEIGGRFTHLVDTMNGDAVLADYLLTLSDEQHAELAAARALTQTELHPETGLLRVHVYFANGTCYAAVRVLRPTAPAFKELGLPDSILKGVSYGSGIVLITGPQNAGKTTLMAALIRYLDESQLNLHILTAEQPVEYLHRGVNCIISQLRVGRRKDANSFADAVRIALRTNARVIAVGEAFADDDTLPAVLDATDAGCLVLLTMHAPNVVTALGRLYDALPDTRRERLWSILGDHLRVACSLRLIPSKYPGMRMPAAEVLLGGDATKAALLNRDFVRLAALQARGEPAGSCTLEQSIAALVAAGHVDVEYARRAAPNPELLTTWLTH